MMFIGNSAEVNREQHEDRLRKIENDRLAKEATINQGKSGVWQSIGHRLSEFIDRKQEGSDKGRESIYALNER